jgi:hypothetical protein
VAQGPAAARLEVALPVDLASDVGRPGPEQVEAVLEQRVRAPEQVLPRGEREDQAALPADGVEAEQAPVGIDER